MSESSHSSEEFKQQSANAANLADTDQKQAEKFGKDSPTITILKQSVGPWIFQTISAMQDAISLVFVSMAYPNTNYSSAISSILFIKTLLFSIDMFFTNGVTIQIAPLLSENRVSTAGQLVADSIRIAVGIALLLFILFAAGGKYLLELVAGSEMLDIKYKYMLTCASELIFVALFEMLNAVLMGEGRSILSASLQMGALVFSTFIIDPILMFGAHVPIWSIGFSPSLGKSILSIILFILFLRGKFGTELKLKMFITCFTPETKTAVKVGLLPLCQMILGLVPTLVMQTIVTKAGAKQGINASGIFGLGLKVYTILIQSATGALSGLYGAVSWSYSKKMFVRIRHLLYSSWILALIPFIIICPIMIVNPATLLSLWDKNEVDLRIGNKLCRPMFYTPFLFAFYQSMTFTLISSTKSILSIIGLVSKATILILGSIIIGSLATDPVYVIYSFVAADIVALIVVIILFRFVGKEIWLGEDEESQTRSELHEDLILA